MQKSLFLLLLSLSSRLIDADLLLYIKETSLPQREFTVSESRQKNEQTNKIRYLDLIVYRSRAASSR
jgi:hypothetical protein